MLKNTGKKFHLNFIAALMPECHGSCLGSPQKYLKGKACFLYILSVLLGVLESIWGSVPLDM